MSAPNADDVSALAGSERAHPLESFQLLAYLNYYLGVVFVFSTALLLMYKKTVLDYPDGYVEAEVIMLILYWFLSNGRWFFGSHSYISDDAGERVSMACLFSLLVIPAVILHGYYRQNQLYVLEIEHAINTAMVGLFCRSSTR